MASLKCSCKYSFVEFYEEIIFSSFRQIQEMHMLGLWYESIQIFGKLPIVFQSTGPHFIPSAIEDHFPQHDILHNTWYPQCSGSWSCRQVYSESNTFRNKTLFSMSSYIIIAISRHRSERRMVLAFQGCFSLTHILQIGLLPHTTVFVALVLRTRLVGW